MKTHKYSKGQKVWHVSINNEVRLATVAFLRETGDYVLDIPENHFLDGCESDMFDTEDAALEAAYWRLADKRNDKQQEVYAIEDRLRAIHKRRDDLKKVCRILDNSTLSVGTAFIPENMNVSSVIVFDAGTLEIKHGAEVKGLRVTHGGHVVASNCIIKDVGVETRGELKVIGNAALVSCGSTQSANVYIKDGAKAMDFKVFDGGSLILSSGIAEEIGIHDRGYLTVSDSKVFDVCVHGGGKLVAYGSTRISGCCVQSGGTLLIDRNTEIQDLQIYAGGIVEQHK